MNRPTKLFACSYHHDGGEWNLTLQAYDQADAEARVKKLGFLKLDGEIMFSCKVPFGAKIAPFIEKKK